MLQMAMIPVRLLRRFAGRGGWIMSIIPRARWTVMRIWAAITACERQRAAGGQVRQGAGHSLVARKQVEAALTWVRVFWGMPTVKLERVFGSQKPHAMLELVFDASPWGLGGFLTDIATGQILQFFADPLTEQDAIRFGKPLGEASGQQCWEALAILVGLRLLGSSYRG